MSPAKATRKASAKAAGRKAARPARPAKSARKAARPKRAAKAVRKAPARKAAKGGKARRVAKAAPTGPGRGTVAPRPAGGQAPMKGRCIASDPFGDPCQNTPRLGSPYCSIHSHLG